MGSGLCHNSAQTWLPYSAGEVQVDELPPALQHARIKSADFAHLAKLRWSSQQLVAAMRLFHQATGHFRRDNLQVPS